MMEKIPFRISAIYKISCVFEAIESTVIDTTGKDVLFYTNSVILA